MKDKSEGKGLFEFEEGSSDEEEQGVRIMKALHGLRIGDLVAKVPIIQGGMGVRVSLSNLSSAVANNGGIGVIAATGIGALEPDFSRFNVTASIRALRTEIRKARALTKGILGVNVLTALNSFGEMVTAAIEEGIDVVFSGAGLPLNLPEYLKEGVSTKLVPIVSSAKAAYLIAKRWIAKYNYTPDAFVVEGPKAGGHLGFSPEQLENPNYDLEKLVPEVKRVADDVGGDRGVSIPVIAAGGIYTTEDMQKMQFLGASGVQLGTRFVATSECDASNEFKNSYIKALESDVIIIKSPVGLPGRAIRNAFLTDVANGIKKPFRCGYQCIKTCNFKDTPYCIADALLNAQSGKLDDGFAFAGANVHRINKIETVSDVFEDLTRGYKTD